MLLHHDRGAFTPAAIQPVGPGGFRVNGLGFDAAGNGWVVGSRTVSEPFLARGLGGQWVEFLAVNEIDLRYEPREGSRARRIGGPPRTAEGVGGGILFGVCVVGETDAIAVGYKPEIDPDGYLGFDARVLQLIDRPFGEVDLRWPTRPDTR